MVPRHERKDMIMAVTLTKTLDAEFYNSAHDYAVSHGFWLGSLAGQAARTTGMVEAPTVDLSGEFVGGFTPGYVIDAIREQQAGTRMAFGDLTPEDAEALVDAWEAAFNDGSQRNF
jgi:hypothetical protein